MKKNTRNWLIIIVTCLLVIMQQCDKNAISIAAVPISKSLGFSKTQIGLVVSIFFIGYTAMNMVGGFLSDKFGAKKVVTVVGILWSTFTGLTGVAWSFESLLIIRLIFGTCEGPFPPTNPKTVAELFPQEKRAFPKSFISATSTLGVGFAAILVTQITSCLGWRNAFWCFAIIGYIITILFIVVSWKWKRPTGKDGKAIKNVRVPLKSLLKSSFFWRMAVINFACGVFTWGLNTWLPSYWMTVRGLSLKAMGFVSFIPSFAGFIVVLGIGWFLDRGLAGKERYVMGIGGGLSALFIFLTLAAPNVALGVTCQTVASIGSSCVLGTSVICIVKYFNENAVGTSHGFLNGATQFAGVIAPTVMGMLLDATKSYVTVFGLVVCMMLVAMALSFTLKTKGLVEHRIADDYVSTVKD